MSIKTGILAITNEVIGDVEKEAQAVILAAENAAKESLKTAKEHADQTYSAIINQATAKAETEKRKIASVTEVDIRNHLLQTKEDLVDVAFENALEKIKEFVQTEEYRDYLLKLIENIAKRIDKKTLTVHVNVKDKGWLTQEMLNRLGKKTHYELELSDQTEECIGGCKLQTEDAKILYDGTIDNRLQELKAVLRVEGAKTLFGETA